MLTVTEQLLSVIANKQIWVAYSGGIDSHVLLHLLATYQPLRNKVNAIHIDHGLHPRSAQWCQHCQHTATQLGVAFTSIKVNVEAIEQMGLEAAARAARYRAFAQQLTANDILCTAQHQQDQAETLLLQLFRGAGPKGLAAMAGQFQLAEINIVRPFINTKHDEIIRYAEQHKLQWLDDPSNSEMRWNRNYIRHKVLPAITRRWPSVAKTISRSAAHCAETNALLVELAQHDLVTIAADLSSDHLSIAKLLTLSPARCRNLLRYYIEQRQLPLPSTVILQQIISNVCQAQQDRVPLLQYAGVDIRRFQDRLYIMPSLPTHDSSQSIACSEIAEVTINDYSRLHWRKQSGQGLKQQLLHSGVTIRFRQGGEQLRLANHAHRKSLKKLFQQWAVPPWQRERIPLIFKGQKLLAVVGYAIDKDSGVAEQESGYVPYIVNK